MQDPTLIDIIAGMLDTSGTLDATDVEFGDEDNQNVTIPLIGGLTASVAYYLSTTTNTPYARITWSWDEPIIYDEDGVPVDPNDPEIQDDMYFDPVVDYMFGIANSGGSPIAFASTKGSTSVVTEEHPVGINATITVYAVTKSGIAGPTSQYTATVTKDTTPPPKPSTPTLSTASSVVTVDWDGLDSIGAAQPADYNYTEVYAGTVNPPTTLVGKLYGKGKLSFLGAPGTTTYVRLFAYDNVMNQSPASNVASIVVKSVLDDTGLQAALASKAVIYAQDTDPAPAVNDGDWWFKTNPSAPDVIDNIYKRVSGAWVQDTFNASQVIAALSIVAGLLAANSVVADNIMAGEIYSKLAATGELTADVISTGVLSALITVSGVLTTATSGQRVVIDSNGIRLIDASDKVRVNLPVTGEAAFDGAISARSLQVSGGSQFDSLNNYLSKNAKLTLMSKIEAPTEPPQINVDYKVVTLKESNGSILVPTAVAATPTAESPDHVVSRVGARFVKNNRATGAYIGEYAAPANTILVAVSGNYAYSFEYNLIPNSIMKLWRTNRTTGNTASYTLSLANGSSINRRIFADPNNNRLWTYIKGSTTITEITITNLTGDTFSATSANKTTTYNLGGAVCRSNFDIGTDSFMYQDDVSSFIRCATYSTMAENTNESFFMYDSSNSTKGLWYKGSVIQIAVNGSLYTYDGPRFTTGLDRVYTAAYTYYSDGGTVRQSKISPVTSMSIGRRHSFNVEIPGWVPEGSGADQINKLRYYVGIAAGTRYLQDTNATGIKRINSSIATSGTTAPGSSSFPAGTPAEVASANGDFFAKGDGKVNIKPQNLTSYPICFGGCMVTDISLTANNYKSIKMSNFLPRTNSPNHGFTWNGDCLVLPYSGLYTINFHCLFSADSTSGNRFVGINVNPGITTNNNSTYPATGRLTYQKFSPSSDTSSMDSVFNGFFNAGDNIMFLARTTSATKVLSAIYQTNFSIQYWGYETSWV